MAVDAKEIKEIVEKIVNKAKNDPNLLKKLQSNPEKTIESLTGIDIPDGAIDQVVKAVKGAINLDKISGVMNKLMK